MTSHVFPPGHYLFLPSQRHHFAHFKLHSNEVKHIPFCVASFSMIYLWHFSVLFHLALICSFSLFCSISLWKYTTVCLSTPTLMDVWDFFLILVHIFYCLHAYIFTGQIPRSETLIDDSRFPKHLHWLTPPPTTCDRSSCSHLLPSTSYGQSFKCSLCW